MQQCAHIHVYTHHLLHRPTSILVNLRTCGSKNLIPEYPHMMAPRVREGPRRWAAELWRRVMGVMLSCSVSDSCAWGIQENSWVKHDTQRL